MAELSLNNAFGSNLGKLWTNPAVGLHFFYIFNPTQPALAVISAPTDDECVLGRWLTLTAWFWPRHQVCLDAIRRLLNTELFAGNVRVCPYVKRNWVKNSELFRVYVLK